MLLMAEIKVIPYSLKSGVASLYAILISYYSN